MKRAFTLIELLVVVGILAILSAVAIASFSSAQKRSREARRISDIGQVSDAIQNHLSLGNDVPTTGGSWGSTDPSGALSVLVSSGLLSSLPKPPVALGTTTRCMVYHYEAPNNQSKTGTGPTGVIGLRQYSLSFASEVATQISAYHPTNPSLMTVSGYAPEAGCNYYSAFLFAPK